MVDRLTGGAFLNHCGEGEKRIGAVANLPTIDMNQLVEQTRWSPRTKSSLQYIAHRNGCGL